MSAGRPGSRADGAARRARIVAATVEILGTDGRAAVSHRRVARRAGVPPAATTYYFASLDDLLAAAMHRAAERDAAQIAAAVGDGAAGGAPAARVAGAIAGRCIGPARVDALAVLELHLDAARRPALRDRVSAWLAEVTDAIAPLLGGDAAAPRAAPRRRAAIASLDGLLLHSLLADPPPTAADLEPVAARILAGAAAG